MKCWLVKFGLSLGLWHCVITGWCISGTTHSRQYKFEHLDLALNNNRVECIIQDSDGFIWIGTLGGLHKYDGVNLTVYTSSMDSTTMDVDRIESLLEDRHKRIWVGTDEGIYQFSKEKNTFKKYQVQDDYLNPADARPQRIEALAEDESGVVWLGSERSGIQYFDEETQQFLSIFDSPEKSKLGQTSVTSLVLHEGFIWASTIFDGLFKINTRTKEVWQCCMHAEDNEFLHGARLSDLMIDQSNRLWIGTDDQGMARLDIEDPQARLKIYKHDPKNEMSLFNNAIVNSFEDSHGDIWICNENGGLHLYNDQNDSFTRFLPDPDNKYSLSNVSIKTVFEDDHGRLWIGTHLAGIDIHDRYRHKFEQFSGKGGKGELSNNVIRSYYEINENELFIATDGGGLNYFNRKNNSYQHFTTANSNLSSDAVLTIEQDRSGKYWVGTWRGGINIYDPIARSFSQPYSHLSSTSRNFYILRASDDRIWVADQLGGLNLFSPEGGFIRAYNVGNLEGTRLVNNGVVVIMEDSKNRIWIGTGDNGVNLLVDEKNELSPFKVYMPLPNDSTSIPNVRINDLFEDSHKNIWIASDGGLSLFQPKTDNFRNYNHFNGISTNAIKSIEEDDQGNLWLGTANGISRFDPVHMTFRNYSHHDGLQPGAFARYASTKLSSGEMIFGGYNGFNLFHPDSLLDNPFPPKLKITGLKIFNKDVDINDPEAPIDKHIGEVDELELNYNQSVFTLSYVGVNYTLSSQNQYAYRLVGLEENWNYVDNKLEATYTNLDPGQYWFELKSANNDGLWNDDPLRLKIKIIPPWWKTLYFRISVIIIIIGVVLLYIRYRTVALERQQIKLERMVVNRTREVKKLNQDLTISEKMASLGVLTTGIAHEINNPLNFIFGASQKLFDILEKAQLNGSLKSEEGEDTIRNLKNIMQVGINKASQIVGSLRNFVKDDSGSFEAFDIVECLDDSLMILRHKIKALDITINSELPTKVEMVCQPGRISQVFVNILNNAIDAVGKRGEIDIRIEQINGDINITISDNGAGISDKEISRLFDPFYSTKDIGKGVGLGLYIVYGIVEEHQGSIEVKSGSTGTTFIIKLPTNLPVITV